MPNQVDFRGEMPSVVSLRFPGHRILGRVLREVSRQDFDSGGPTTDIGAGSHRRSSSEATELVNVPPNMRVERHIQAPIRVDPRFGRGTGTGQQERSCSSSHLKTIFAIMPLSS